MVIVGHTNNCDKSNSTVCNYSLSGRHTANIVDNIPIQN